MKNTKIINANDQRQLKVYPKYVSRKYDNVLMPEIRLSGRWLERLGFAMGKGVIVKQERNKITITVKDGV